MNTNFKITCRIMKFDNEEKIEIFKDIKQEYDDWLEFYESTHDDVFYNGIESLCICMFE